MYNGVEFFAAPAAECDWLFEVIMRGTVTGRIRLDEFSETYIYYRVPGSETAPFHEEKELSVLFDRVAHMP